MPIPTTSVTLIETISGDSTSGRWAEFYAAYLPLMRGYLAKEYPSLDPDDIIQETMASLVRTLRNYRYSPTVNGHFRNYLIGVVKHKALDFIRRRTCEAKHREDFREHLEQSGQDSIRDDESERNEWLSSALEVAIDELLADESINPSHREIFRHVAIMHESPATVAESFGFSRNNVDQISRRLKIRLKAILERLVKEA